MTPRVLSGLCLLSIGISVTNASVILTEFLAQGNEPWVELYNDGSNSIDLTGYQLRAAADEWRLENLTLLPNAFVVIPLKIKRQGDLALIHPSGEILTSYESYPAQRDGISYGLNKPDQRPGYFPTPSPGEPNSAGVLGFVADTKFSINGGFYEEPIELEITSATPGAVIEYTTDGSIPSLFNRNSKRYAGPITIDHIMIIRAWAAKPGYEPTNLDTHTYIFRNDVLHQPQFPDGFPESWGSGPGVNAVMPGLSDYEVDPRIRDATYVDRDGETFTLDDALRSIPSLAVTLPIKTLLGPETGLHALARNKGAEWERPISLEYFEESGNRAFQINGGIRMQGGWNRLPESFKKSFRFYFRSEYGDSKLEYPLFPDSNVTTFDTLILRAGNGKAWSSPWRPLTGSTNNSLERVTYLRDQLPRDLQHDMGHPTSHGRFVHLYINGLYWGLYNLVERVDEWFGPGYFGGDEEDYDVIKWIRSEGMVISAGNDDAWQDLLRLVRSDIELQETYEAAAALVDLENLIDYMLINFYIGNSDWPDNNSYTFRKRTDDGRFRFVSWDAEESLVETSANSLSKNNTSTCAEVFQRLRRNEEFQVLLKDRIAKHFSAGGILTDAYVSQRHLGRAREIDRAIVGESARWGDLLRSGQPYTRDHWMDELDNLEDNFFGRGDGSREEVTYNQMRSSKWTSPDQAPRLTLPEGFVPRGSEVAISKASIFAIGTPYFTTDGSDPRLFGGELNPNAIQGPQTITIDASTTIKARLLANERWSPIVEVRYSIGIPASGENITISELMYHPATDEAPEYLELANHSDQEVNLQGSTFEDGILFDFENDTILAPGEHVILTNDLSAFKQHYGTEIRVIGEFSNGTRLSNSGETVTFRAENGAIIASLRYDNTLELADGGGHSLIAKGDAWQLSQDIGGDPGTESLDLIQETLATSPIIARDGDTLHLILERWLSANDTHILTIEFSNDLTTWTTLETPSEQLSVNDAIVTEKRTLPNTSESQFVRVRITRP